MPTPATLPLEATVDALGANAPLWAIVFAGGIGSRFWPLSSPQRPKPTLQLLGERPLIADAIRRLAPLVPAERVLVATSRDIAAAVRAVLPDLPAENFLVEPRPLGTAAALAWGLEVIRQRGGAFSNVCALHADLTADFPDEFRRALRRAVATAIRERALVTLGVIPTRPESAFGYAVPGEPIDADTPVWQGGVCRVTRFVEKPGLDVLTQVLMDGALWHACVLVARTADLTEQLYTHATELARGREALARGNLPAFAGLIDSVSIERGLLERSDNLVVVPVECGWDDVGTWASVRRARDLDDDGNGAIGDVAFVDSESNVVHAEDGAVVVFGCERLLVVTLPGLTFVTTLDKAADLRPLLDQLPAKLRFDLTRPPT